MKYIIILVIILKARTLLDSVTTPMDNFIALLKESKENKYGKLQKKFFTNPLYFISI